MLRLPTILANDWLRPVFVGLVAFCVAMAISLTRWPTPIIHDDFGYLLIADTLCHGRLANPTPQDWTAFQTIYTIFEPSYASKYPIGTGLLLATGNIALGTEVAGLWLSAALASACLTWMLRGHFPRRWTLCLALLVALHPVWQFYWSQRFTNGWVAMAGASLVLGGSLRCRRLRYHAAWKQSKMVQAGLGLGAGAVLLSLSRPFEGGLFCLMAGSYLLYLTVKNKWWSQPKFYVAVIPGLFVLAAGATLQILHNQSVTGDWTELPYQHHEKQYAFAPNFMWSSPHSPTMPHRYPMIRQLYETQAMDNYREARTVSGYFERWGRRFLQVVSGWSIFGALPFLCLWIQPRPRFYLGLALMIGLQFTICSFVPAVMSHYFAPLVPIAVIFTGVSLRWLKNQGTSRKESVNAQSIGHSNRFIVALVLLQAMTLTASWVPYLLRPSHWSERRAQMLSQLNQRSQPSIVFVKYRPEHNVEDEWVFNGADFATSKVLWAQDQGTTTNAQVLLSYPGRQAWLLQPDEAGAPLIEYPGLGG